MKQTKKLALATFLLLASTLTACAPEQALTETESAEISVAASATPVETEIVASESLEPTVATATAATQSSEKPRIQDDLYESVNYDWLQTATINSDQPSTGSFTALSNNVVDDLIADLQAGFSDNGVSKEGTQGQMYQYYQLALDIDRLNKEGIEPIQPTIDAIQSFKNIAEFAQFDNRESEIFTMVPTIYSFGVGSDMKDSSKNTVYIGTGGLLLPDKTYYGTPAGDQLLEVYSTSMQAALKIAGYDDATAKKMLEDTIEIDALMMPLTRSAEESSDVTKMYNPYTYEEFREKFNDKPFDILSFIEKRIGQKPTEIIVTNPEMLEGLATIYTDENWNKIQNYLIVNTLYGSSDMLSDEILSATSAYSLALSGQEEVSSRQKDAFTYTNSLFGDVVGEIYVEKHFSPQAKTDVEEMTKKMIGAYEVSLNANDWLSETTKKTAIEKLKAITIQVGYPDKTPIYYENIKIDVSKSLLENTVKGGYAAQDYMYAQYGKPVDRTEWGMPAQTVNAFYDPLNNMVTFPAAFLQAPFYDINRSASENYGGIGAVIAHEISHAFDTNGSKYDKNGNLNDWWMPEDYIEFEKRTQAMIEQFNNQTLDGKPVNGTLTISENVADAGGLHCALSVVETLPDRDLEAFFKSWATIWQIKSTPEYEDLLLSMDTHAPNKLRANVQVRNLDAFYDVFGVVEGDEMWLAPENRIVIW